MPGILKDCIAVNAFWFVGNHEMLKGFRKRDGDFASSSLPQNGGFLTKSF
jgi:hypothetical protein